MTWIKAPEAAALAGVSVKTIYRAVRDGHLRAARVGAGRNIRLCPAWIDEWLERSSGDPRMRVAISRKHSA
jgi:excisionase family DNA binding protein